MSNNTFDSAPQLPDNISKYFKHLYRDVVLLKEKWSFYLKLFGEEKNLELLSELAPASFQIIEDSLRNDMTMAISRLADPPESRGYKNLSLEALVQQLDKPGDEINNKLQAFKKTNQPFKEYRHKYVGHNDLEKLISPPDNYLLRIWRKDVDKIVQIAEELLKLVWQHYTSDNELSFKLFRRDNADTLIFWLKEAKEYNVMKISERIW